MEQFVQLKLTEYNRLKAIDEASKPNKILHIVGAVKEAKCGVYTTYSFDPDNIYFAIKKDVVIEKMKEHYEKIIQENESAIESAKLLTLKLRSYEAACNRYRSIWLIKLFYK